MRNKFAFSLLFLTVLTFFGCSLDDDENFHFVAFPITSVQMPDTFDLNQTYEIKVTYKRDSDCAYFEGFDVIKEDKTIRNVAAIGSMLIDSEDCQEVLQEVETSFNFIVLYDENYLFKFYTGDDENGDPEYLEIEVPVN
tara:strand:- start:648 stop:1064 length:417 start_codon:yes stop_codon:yes gene_type:complete